MSPVFTSSLFFSPFPDLCQESPLQAARSSWRAKKQAAEEEEEEEEGEKEDGRREITAWQQTLQPPPHPIEGSYLQVKCCVVWERRIMGKERYQVLKLNPNIARGITDPEIDSMTWVEFGNHMAPIALIENLATI